MKITPIIALILSASVYCSESTSSSSTSTTVVQTFRTTAGTIPEGEYTELVLEAGLTSPLLEISGLTWTLNQLVILPQYPDKMGNFLYRIDRRNLLRSIQARGHGDQTPVEHELVQVEFGSWLRMTSGYEGFEAIVFEDRSVWMLIEARDADAMFGYLVKGDFDPNSFSVDMRNPRIFELPKTHPADNRSYETLTKTADSGLLVLHETNGSAFPNRRKAIWVDDNLTTSRELPMDRIEFRTTDATAIENGKFFVTNVLWDGDWEQLKVDSDPELAHAGIGKSHLKSGHIERILELEYADNTVRRTSRAPLYIQLSEDGKMRNWEGLVRIDAQGFVVATDTHPTNKLAFVLDLISPAVTVTSPN